MVLNARMSIEIIREFQKPMATTRLGRQLRPRNSRKQKVPMEKGPAFSVERQLRESRSPCVGLSCRA